MSENKKNDENVIIFKTDKEYKGLETDIVIYCFNPKVDNSIKYIGYTRARYYLYILTFYE